MYLYLFSRQVLIYESCIDLAIDFWFQIYNAFFRLNKI